MLENDLSLMIPLLNALSVEGANFKRQIFDESDEID